MTGKGWSGQGSGPAVGRLRAVAVFKAVRRAMAGSLQGWWGPGWRWAALTAATPGVILAVVGILEPHFTYNRWDNYEYFTSAITAAHAQWLEGGIPLWNPHQHMG